MSSHSDVRVNGAPRPGSRGLPGSETSSSPLASRLNPNALSPGPLPGILLEGLIQPIREASLNGGQEGRRSAWGCHGNGGFDVSVWRGWEQRQSGDGARVSGNICSKRRGGPPLCGSPGSRKSPAGWRLDPMWSRASALQDLTEIMGFGEGTLQDWTKTNG